MAKNIYIKFAQFYEIEDVKRVPCYPNNLNALGDEPFNLPELVLQVIDLEGRLIIKQIHHLNDFSFRTLWFDGSPFMIEKLDSFRENPIQYWVTDVDTFQNAFAYLKTKQMYEFPIMENGRVVKPTDGILPVALEINDKDAVSFFKVEPVVKKVGVMAIGAKDIIPGTKYWEYLVFVSENTEPITKIICRRGAFMKWVKTYTAEELNAINPRILEPLVWKYGKTRDVHLYSVVDENPDITEFDFV